MFENVPMEDWAKTVARACPLTPQARLVKPGTPEIREKIGHLIPEKVQVLGIVLDDNKLFVAFMAPTLVDLNSNFRRAAGEASRAFDIEPKHLSDYGQIYAIDKNFRPLTDAAFIKDNQDKITYCRLFLVYRGSSNPLGESIHDVLN